MRKIISMRHRERGRGDAAHDNDNCWFGPTTRNHVYDAIINLGNVGHALLLDWDKTSRLLVLSSGEIFRLDRDSVTRLG